MVNIKDIINKNKEINGVIDKKIKNVVNKNNDKYYGFWHRVFFNAVICLVLLVFGIVFLIKSFGFENEKIVEFSEHSTLDYKVYLKDNEFYDQEYLGKDMIYVASLIDNIKTDFKYNFRIDEKKDIKFDYQIIAKLKIQDSDEKYTYYEKDYILLEEKGFELDDDNSKSIDESIDIDYNYYNRIANSFKNTYGVGITSKLVIFFNIYKISSDDNWNIVDNLSNSILNIPLSEKSINIDMNYLDIDNNSYIVNNSKVNFVNVIFFIISVIFIVFSMVYSVKLIRLLKKLSVKKNEYDRYIDKILNEYDRLIVETTTAPTILDENKENVIVIEKFSELLDVRDNLKQPIMYYIVNRHEKCYFYIMNNQKIYLNVVKQVDLVKQNEKSNKL